MSNDNLTPARSQSTQDSRRRTWSATSPREASARAAYDFPLDPEYEPERSDEQRANPDIPSPDPRKNEIFAVLQRYVKVNLVRPEDYRALVAHNLI
jgi:hypothetical protein